MDGFDAAMQSQRTRARKANKFSHSDDLSIKVQTASSFVGYEYSKDNAEIKELFFEGKTTTSLAKNQKGL